jgi:hypothetical protein
VSGRSGTLVAPHTRLVTRGATSFAISEAQAEIVGRAIKQGGECCVDGQLRSVKPLVSFGIGTLKDDCPEDGGFWIFQLADGVTLR